MQLYCLYPQGYAIIMVELPKVMNVSVTTDSIIGNDTTLIGQIATITNLYYLSYFRKLMAVYNVDRVV